MSVLFDSPHHPKRCGSLREGRDDGQDLLERESVFIPFTLTHFGCGRAPEIAVLNYSTNTEILRALGETAKHDASVWFTGA